MRLARDHKLFLWNSDLTASRLYPICGSLVMILFRRSRGSLADSMFPRLKCLFRVKNKPTNCCLSTCPMLFVAAAEAFCNLAEQFVDVLVVGIFKHVLAHFILTTRRWPRVFRGRVIFFGSPRLATWMMNSARFCAYSFLPGWCPAFSPERTPDDQKQFKGSCQPTLQSCCPMSYMSKLYNCNGSR